MREIAKHRTAARHSLRVASLRLSYSLLAPFYDRVVEKATIAMRRRSLARMKQLPRAQSILINGIGSGLDLELLSPGPTYFGLDLTPNMIQRARHRAGELDCHLQIGNAMCLPYQSSRFDLVILHLILAVTPNPVATLVEACRVVKPGGHLLIMDKFLRPGQIAPLRRIFSPLISLFATQTHVVWEQVLAQAQQGLRDKTPAIEIALLSDEADLAGGWFRRITLKREA